jgi:probable rRNA maturation factor
MRALEEMSGALIVLFVDPRAMKHINRQYRKRDYATDVLSFAYGNQTEDGVPYLGDVVIAPEIAASNAEAWGGSAEKEVRKLLVHGILHLLGHDHETDEVEMEKIQARLLRRRFFVDVAPVLACRKLAGVRVC